MTTIELKATDSVIIFDEDANPTIHIPNIDEVSMGVEWATAIICLMHTDDDFVKGVWEKWRMLVK